MKRRFWTHPAAHLVIGGTLLFVADAARGRANPQSIVVSADLQAAWERDFVETYGRTPSAGERIALEASFVEDEALHRRAIELGLHRDDPIVRRRLIQKMRFLLEDDAARVPIDEGELRAWFERHAEQFEVPTTVAFEHRFFDPAQREDAEAAAEAAARQWAEGVEPLDADAFVHGPSNSSATEAWLTRTFSDSFAQGVFAIQAGAVGVVRSRYGLHAVRVSEIHRPPPVEFESVRDAVEEHWRAAHESELLREATAALAERYGVQRRDR